jgi:hypothetical protein
MSRTIPMTNGFTTAEKITFSRSLGKTLFIVLGALAFVAIGYLVFSASDEGFHRIGGAICILFFGAVAVSAALSLARGREALVIDRSAIRDLRRGVEISWPAIARIRVIHVGGVRFLGLDVRDLEQFRSSLTPRQRNIIRFHERAGYGHWGFNFSGINPGIDQALTFIRDQRPDVRVEE